MAGKMKRYRLWENNGGRVSVVDEGPYDRKTAMFLAASMRRKSGRRIYARGSK